MYKNRVRDPVHGFIHFFDREKMVIDTPHMQRLKNIKQLAFTYYVYPGAMHSRFEHSLGVMHLAGKIYDSIYLKKPRLIDDAIKSFAKPGQTKEIIRLAALMHDIGHLPFSHTGEAVLPRNMKHEDVSLEIIGRMAEYLDDLYFIGATDLVVKLLKGNVPLELKFLADILSGQVDADRMDYLLRDSLHCGVEYGNFDCLRLIECLTVHESDTGIELAIQRGGVHALEALILARYYMFTQVYGHRTRRIYDIYLVEFLRQQEFDFNPLCKVCEHDDISTIVRLRQTAQKEKEEGIIGVATRLLSRHHHSVIFETSDFADIRDKQQASSIFERLKEKYPQFEFIIDPDGCGGNIHKFYVDGDEEEGVYFYVITADGRKSLISDESRIIGKIHKKFRAIRIYTNQKDTHVIQDLKKEVRGG